MWWGLVACAGSQLAPQHAPVLELSLTSADGQRAELSAWQGQRVLLFLFATYDEASQYEFVPLEQLLASERQLQVLGVALQPEAATFLKLFKRAVAVPFELYYDADNRVLHKQTALGALRGVPAFVALDAEGRIRGVHYGLATLEQLQALAAKSREP
jgi:hypothetical protein